MNPQALQERELDALREVANIGAGHAATALSQMTQARIDVQVPRLQIARPEDVAELIEIPDRVVAAVLLQVVGDLAARCLLVFPQEDAARLSRLLLRRIPTGPDALDEMERSAIMEVGNILCGAYMNALSEFMGMMLLPSVPTLVVDLCGAVLTSACSDSFADAHYVFSIETEFVMEGEAAISGHFLLLPALDSLGVLLRALRLA